MSDFKCSFHFEASGDEADVRAFHETLQRYVEFEADPKGVRFCVIASKVKRKINRVARAK